MKGGALILIMWEKPFSLDYEIWAPSPLDLGKSHFLWVFKLGRPHLEKEGFLEIPRGGALIWFGGSLENSSVGAPSFFFERSKRVRDAF